MALPLIEGSNTARADSTRVSEILGSTRLTAMSRFLSKAALRTSSRERETAGVSFAGVADSPEGGPSWAHPVGLPAPSQAKIRTQGTNLRYDLFIQHLEEGESDPSGAVIGTGAAAGRPGQEG